MFKHKQEVILVVGFLCVILLGYLLNTSRLTAERSPQQIQDLDKISDVVSHAIISRSYPYPFGELKTEGHTILDAKEENGVVKVYTLSSMMWFGFENGIFTMVSGWGAIPTVITFSKNEQGEYSLLEYKEVPDGNVEKSVKDMFPEDLWSKVLPTQVHWPELAQQEVTQAEAYLKNIGRTATVSATVDRQLAKINTGASNKLVMIARHDSLIGNCPFWIGTREQIESGIRFIYEKSQSKTSDGYDLITFRKLKEDGSLVEEKKYKIVENEPQLMD